MLEIIRKIKPTQILPIVLIIINLFASGICVYNKEYKKAVYWLAAAILNITVTF